MFQDTTGITLHSKRYLKNCTTDALLDEIEELPVRMFGQREYGIFSHAVSATVSDNYPDDIIVIEVEDHEGDTMELLVSDDEDKNNTEPYFIG